MLASIDERGAAYLLTEDTAEVIIIREANRHGYRGNTPVGCGEERFGLINSITVEVSHRRDTGLLTKTARQVTFAGIDMPR